MVYLCMGIYILMIKLEGDGMNQSNGFLTGSFLYTERDHGILLFAESAAGGSIKIYLYFLYNAGQAVIEPESVQADLWMSDIVTIEEIDGVTGTFFSNEYINAVFGWTEEGEFTYDLGFADGTNLTGVLKRNEETYIDEWLNCLREQRV